LVNLAKFDFFCTHSVRKCYNDIVSVKYKV